MARHTCSEVTRLRAQIQRNNDQLRDAVRILDETTPNAFGGLKARFRSMVLDNKRALAEAK